MDFKQLIPFASWLSANGISRTSGYRLAKEGLINITKIRSRSYITAEEAERFVKSLNDDENEDA